MERTKQSEPVKPTRAVATHLTPIMILVIVVLCFVGGYFYLNGQWFSPENPESHAGVGWPIEYVQLEPLTGDGQPVSRAEITGRVVLLNIWGTWCPPCRRELPHMAELRRRFAGQEDFLLLAVSYPGGSQTEDVRSLKTQTAQMLDKLSVDMPTYYDPQSNTLAALRGTINFQGFPTTLLLDRQGVIRAVWVGFRPGVETEMERYIGKLLEE